MTARRTTAVSPTRKLIAYWVDGDARESGRKKDRHCEQEKRKRLLYLKKGILKSFKCSGQRLFFFMLGFSQSDVVFNHPQWPKMLSLTGTEHLWVCSIGSYSKPPLCLLLLPLSPSPRTSKGAHTANRRTQLLSCPKQAGTHSLVAGG